MDIAKGEATEKELDALIRRRHDQRVALEGERVAEELWVASERIYQEKRRRRQAWEWVRYYEEQAARAERNGAEVAAANRRKAEALLRELESETTSNGHHERGAA